MEKKWGLCGLWLVAFDFKIGIRLKL